MGHWGASGLRPLQTVTLLFPHVLKIFPQDIQAFSVSQAFAPDRFRDLFRAHLGLMWVHDCRSCTEVPGDHVMPNAKGRNLFMTLLLKDSSVRKAQQLLVLTVYWPRKRRYNSMFCSFPERLRPCKVHPDDLRSHVDAVQPLNLGKIHVSSVEFLLLSVRLKTNTLQSGAASSCQQRAPSKRACVLLRLTRCIVVLTVRRVCNSPSLCVCVCVPLCFDACAYALHPVTRFCVIRRRCACVYLCAGMPARLRFASLNEVLRQVFLW